MTIVEVELLAASSPLTWNPLWPQRSALGIVTVSVEIETRNRKLLEAPGIATRSKDATRGSWPYY